MKLATIITAALLSVYGLESATAQSSAKDTAQIQTVLHTYAQSIDAADATLAGTIWSHTTEVSFIYPLGTEKSYDEIMRDLYTHVMGETFTARDLQIHDPKIHVYENFAWSEFTWTFHATLRGNGKNITTEGRETQVYRKENGGWRIVHVHYSGPPVTGPGQSS
jgi:ketosteroid isomerase-like protein